MEVKEWIKAAPVANFPANSGGCVLINGEQIAVFNFEKENRWYATENKCPHQQEMVISRGLTGDNNGQHKVSCPLHKRSFSLEDGKCLTDEEYRLKTYPVKIEDDHVFIGIQ